MTYFYINHTVYAQLHGSVVLSSVEFHAKIVYIAVASNYLKFKRRIFVDLLRNTLAYIINEFGALIYGSNKLESCYD